MIEVVVIIPIHKCKPTKNELESFKQCFKILGKYPIKIIAPENLYIGEYKNIIPDFDILYIDPIWQSNINQYNKLKINRYFYEPFKDYNFLLTYELDAWVFEDQLSYWCRKEYDYIGAPWLEGWNKGGSTKFIGVGNSGFSLRHVKNSVALLKELRITEILNDYKNLNLKGLLPRLKSLIVQLIKVPNTPSKYEIAYLGNEDGFWGIYAPLFIKKFYTKSTFINLLFKILIKQKFRIASIEEAIPFSFEVNPKLLYEMNHEKLPFGCHAWEKYDPEFWKPFIKIN